MEPTGMETLRAEGERDLLEEGGRRSCGQFHFNGEL